LELTQRQSIACLGCLDFNSLVVQWQALAKGDQTLKELKIVEYNSKRILTTSQVAEALGTDEKIIRQNFERNPDRYTAGKHYFLLEGKELKQFKLTTLQNDASSNRINKLYLWTEKGILMHVKSVNTDIAWQAHEELVETYFYVQETKQSRQELPVYFNRQTQDRCRENEELLPEGYWCVETEMVSQALVLQSLQKELHHWCLPSGSGGKAWVRHLRKVNHPLLDEDSKVALWVPNLQSPTKIMVYPYALLSEFRRWLRVEYAEYYDTKYSPSRVKGDGNKQIR
jgi:hypothetical protein